MRKRESSMPSVAATLATQIAAKGFGDLFSDLLKRAIKPREKADPKQELSEAKFRTHLQQTFEKCTKMKTLISRDNPIDMLSQYVHIHFHYSDKNKRVTAEDYEVIDILLDKKRAVITGTAGGGKTVFMKYLWISYFVNSKNKIPLFLELRRLNDLTSPDIISYIFKSVLTSDSDVGRGGSVCLNNGMQLDK